ncbi:hypothetical protein CAOG_009404 [Capsaspora owczarzaki ATCC 30864]|uniref:RNI-like protein n=1 Tax=Capsaspora owczarzaki (strain ATCC 30864) TaxID=595528 RepID=A0A0D2X0Y6_CAPO3|nr:hypothetical protein CAOG_009404 [Capsaspora owczarzaki ATCC 30864]
MAALSASLRHLSLQCCISITDDMLSVLHGLANLKTLSLAQCTVTDRGVIPLLGAIGAHLEELYIDELAIGPMTNETVANIATHAPELKQINLTRCGTLSDLGVGQLVLHCPRLRVLSLNSLNNLTPALFACIAHDRELFDQAIEATRLHHAQLPVRRNPTTGVVIVDPLPEPTAFSAQALTDLQVLDVSWCRSMDDPSFAAIVRSCEQLSRIEIFGCNRLTECIRSLKPASQLRIVGAPFEIAELGGVSEA